MIKNRLRQKPNDDAAPLPDIDDLHPLLDVQQVVVTSAGGDAKIISADELPAEAVGKLDDGCGVIDIGDDGVCREVYELPKAGEVWEPTGDKHAEDDGWLLP